MRVGACEHVNARERERGKEGEGEILLYLMKKGADHSCDVNAVSTNSVEK